jgi:uncharacterized alpha-E superfamily protein
LPESWTPPWPILKAGTSVSWADYSERADKTGRILDVKYYILLPSVTDIGSPLDDLQWIALLKSASAYEMYRKSQYRITPGG